MRSTAALVRPATLLSATLCVALAACAVPPPVQWPLTEIARSPLGGVTTSGREVVRDAATWARRWNTLQPTGMSPPAVDFSAEMVLVAVMGGRRTGGYSIEISAVAIVDDQLMVTVRETAPPPGAITTQMLTAPFHAVRIARSDLPVRWVSAP